MLLPFTKAHGTGNHFIIIDLLECPKLKLNEYLISKLCDYNTGIGADGLIIISEHEKYDFKMDYYNKDGTWETMCANGARCVGLLLYKKGIINEKANFITGDGEHNIKIINEENIGVTISSPKYTSDEIIVENLNGFSVDSGAKHFVVEVNQGINLDWYVIGKKIRNSHYFPDGTNVNFVKKINQNTLSVITYEKGVEKIMQSCGSGSVAAAFHMHKKYDLNNDLTIQVSGGELSISADSNWETVWLTGPAQLIFHSTIDITKL